MFDLIWVQAMLSVKIRLESYKADRKIVKEQFSIGFYFKKFVTCFVKSQRRWCLLNQSDAKPIPIVNWHSNLPALARIACFPFWENPALDAGYIFFSLRVWLVYFPVMVIVIGQVWFRFNDDQCQLKTALWRRKTFVT